MERNYKVYKHTSPSNKVYIGITGVDPVIRWGNGKKYTENEHFTNAINKYGWDNFKHEILFDNLTKEEAELMEQFYIALYDSTNREKGYNKSTGGKSGRGVSPSKEQREKQSKRMSGKNNPMYGKDWREGKSEEEIKKHNDKISKANTGRKHTPEEIEKMSKRMSGKNNPMYGMTGENNPWYGKTHTEEAKQKIREKCKHFGFDNPKSEMYKVIDCFNNEIGIMTLTEIHKKLLNIDYQTFQKYIKPYGDIDLSRIKNNGHTRKLREKLKPFNGWKFINIENIEEAS